MRTRHRWGALLALALMVSALPVGAAAQEATQCVGDEPGDVRDGDVRVDFPPGDILEVCYAHTPAGLVVSYAMAQPLDPAVDPLWQDGALLMEAYPVRPGAGPGEGAAEGRAVQIVYYARDGDIQVFTRPIVFGAEEDFTCFGTASFEDGRYVSLLPWHCIPTQEHVALRTLWAVFSPDDHNYLDAAPGMCCVPPPPSEEEQAPPAPSSSPGSLTHGTRLDGGGVVDPVGQAVATSQHLFGGGEAHRVVLATADRFPDALAGAALAGSSGPILFTSGLGGLDARVEQEIARVTGGDGEVLVLGGTAAVSQDAASQAMAAAGGGPCAAPLPPTCRFAGDGREETAALVAEVVMAEAAQDAADGEEAAAGDTVLLARSDDFADALTGGAYAARTGTPVLLTPTDLAHPATAAFLEEHQPDRIVALGGPAAISDDTLQALPADRRDRVAGPERTATAAAIADQLWRAAGIGDGGVVLVNVRDPQGWQTALAAAVAAAVHDAPQLGVESPPGPLSASTVTAIGALGAPVQAFGDPGLVSDRHVAEAVTAAG